MPDDFKGTTQVCQPLQYQAAFDVAKESADLSRMVGVTWENLLTACIEISALCGIRVAKGASKERIARAIHACRRSPRGSRWYGKKIRKSYHVVKNLYTMRIPKAVIRSCDADEFTMSVEAMADGGVIARGYYG